MELVVAIIALVVFVALVVLTTRRKPVTPHTLVKAVRAGRKTWTPYSGCLRDAQVEGWRWAALKDGRIVDVAAMKDTGRRFRKRKK